TGLNGGYAAAVNAGIAALDLDGLDGVYVLNPDCRLRPGAIKPLLACLPEPGRGLAVPYMVNPDGSLQPSLRRRPTVGRAGEGAGGGGDRRQPGGPDGPARRAGDGSARLRAAGGVRLGDGGGHADLARGDPGGGAVGRVVPALQRGDGLLPARRRPGLGHLV